MDFNELRYYLFTVSANIVLLFSISIETTKNELAGVEKQLADNESNIEIQKELITKIDFYLVI